MQPTTSDNTPQALSADRRIVIIDLLRGFALFGIIINHISMHYLAGPPPPGNEQFNIIAPWDSGVYTASQLLTFGKFFTIFSFLFGLSFALQMESATRKGIAFSFRFLWRLLILFTIGFVHNLFYSGDILVIYAVLGLLLLPFRYLGNKMILAIAFFLVLNVPALIQDIVHLAAPAPSAEALAAQQDAGKNFGVLAAEQYRIKQSGTIAEVVQMNAAGGLSGKLIFQIMSGRLWITFGLFLLGLYAGRKQIFSFNPANHQRFRKIFLWSGISALVSTVVALGLGISFGRAASIQQAVGNFAFSIHQATLSAFYAAGLVLLYWKAQGKNFLRFLGPVGQMGLSTYLIQTVFGLLVYFGFGLGMMGKLGVASSIAMGIGFFLLQVAFANWWMRYFRFGLVEWFWRSLTYFQIQPLRKRAVAAPKEQAAATTTVVIVDEEKQPSA